MFFVATKAFFNKTPRVFYNQHDIARGCDNKNLAKTLSYCLELLPTLFPSGCTGLYQADVMFRQDELFRRAGLVCAKPNTIVYGTEDESVLNYKLGIAVHTEYVDRGGKLVPVPVSTEFSSNKAVYVFPVDIPTKGLLKKVECDDRTPYITSFWWEKLKRFRNHRARFGMDANPLDVEASFRVWMDFEHKKDLNSVKTLKAKQRKEEAFREVMATFEPEHLVNYWNYQQGVVGVKENLIDKLDTMSPGIFKPFFENGKGLVPTGHEGYVLFDGYHSTKLVKRHVFSAENFKQD